MSASKWIGMAALTVAGMFLMPVAGFSQKDQSLVSYGRTLDAHDFGAYSRLFAKDGEWIGGFGSVKGPAAIEAFMVKNIGTPGKPSGTYHLLTNFLIDVHGDSATTWSRWTFVTPGPDKKPAMAQGGHYEDTLIRESGKWKFSRREAFNDIPAGPPPAAATIDPR